MSDNQMHHHEQMSMQQKNEMIKLSITTQMQTSLQNIYKSCSNFCIKDYKKSDLSDREKVCLSRCFDKKNQTFQLTMEYLGKI